jgi:hypothetical protein
LRWKPQDGSGSISANVSVEADQLKVFMIFKITPEHVSQLSDLDGPALLLPA